VDEEDARPLLVGAAHDLGQREPHAVGCAEVADLLVLRGLLGMTIGAFDQKWWWGPESNRRPRAYETLALTD
jgi:hypothetical protein